MPYSDKGKQSEYMREKVLLRQREYTKAWRKAKQTKGGSYVHDYIVDVFNFKSDDKDIICSFFGCGKKLSLIESLAGSKCTKHMNINKTA